MIQDDPPQFVPFAPNFQPPQSDSPPLVPDGNKPAKPPRKRASGTKKASAASIGEGRTMKEAKQERQPRPRRAAKAKPSRKYDLQTILKIAGTLKEADQPVFEKLLGELSALAKGSCERVLKALGEVFG